MTPTLTFLGGARTVTGSKFLFEGEGRRILVDCGLYQGIKELRLLNWAPFPIDPATIDVVLLTHAHLDHVGYLPLLVKQGFRGPIYCSPPTASIAEVILLDSSRIQEEDAMRATSEGYSKHAKPRPLFNTDEARRAIRQFQTVSPGTWHPLFPHLRFRMTQSGHILGSTFIELEFRGKRLVFSGDLGRRKPLLLPPPSAIERADYLVLESTYGDRNHSRDPVLKTLERIVNETVARGENLIIPSFAVGRSQDLLHLFSQLRQQHAIPDIPIFLDSPMGVSATRIFCNFPEWHRTKLSHLKLLGETATMVSDAKQSRGLVRSHKRKIIIAGSGMVAGGRVLAHLEKALPHSRNTILLVGYQAEGTRGRSLREGATEIKMFGQYVPVKARIEEISSLSAHADQSEILWWLRTFKKAPKEVFLVHGEPQASDGLRVKIQDSLGWRTSTPTVGQTISLKK